MIIGGLSHEDTKKLKEQQKGNRKIQPRKRRTGVLSKKAQELAMKNFEASAPDKVKDSSIQVDERVKMNDNYMRTGWYKPKKK